MAEEANAIDAQNIATNINQPSEPHQQPALSNKNDINDMGLSGGNYANDGVRSPD